MNPPARTNTIDLIIIGAGVAGLAAASELGSSGLRIVILEGRDRIGGRIFTQRDPVLNEPIELGAEFVHGRPPEIWDLLGPAGVRPEEVTGNNWCFNRGQLCTCDFFSAVDELLGKLSDEGPDESFTEFLTRCGSGCDKETKQWVLAYIRGFHAADPDLISTHWIVKGMRTEEKIDGERGFHIPRGYEFLVELLRKQLNPSTCLELGRTVERITWSSGQVHVQVAGLNSPMKAARVLTTVPLGVLQNVDGKYGLMFDPELPASKRGAMDKLAMGHVARIVLRFKERFWDKLRVSDHPGATLSNMRFLFSHEECFPTWWTTLPRKLPIITGWAPAPGAEQLSGQSKEYVVQSALHTLGKLMGTGEEQLSRLLESAWWHDWQADPFSRGAYSYVKKGGDAAPRELAAPVENTLFFAGEATDTSGQNGTVHGAIASGRRAAKEILRSL